MPMKRNELSRLQLCDADNTSLILLTVQLFESSKRDGAGDDGDSGGSGGSGDVVDDDDVT